MHSKSIIIAALVVAATSAPIERREAPTSQDSASAAGDLPGAWKDAANQVEKGLESTWQQLTKGAGDLVGALGFTQGVISSKSTLSTKTC